MWLFNKGVTEDKMKAIKENDDKTIQVTVTGSEYTISSAFGTRSFTLGKETDEPLPNGIVLKVRVTHIYY